MFDILTENRFRMSRLNKNRVLTLLVFTVAIVVSAHPTVAQTTTFTYQGHLTDAGAPANGAHDFEFKLYDATGAQVGATLTRDDIQVTSGVFVVELDFGVTPFALATANALEIGVRPGASTGLFTTLAPRQPITSSPYAIKSLSAAQLGDIAADQYVLTGDPRLSDERPPATGSNNYIQSNPPVQQAGSSFNISGDGVAAGTMSGGLVNAVSQYNIGGQRVLSATGPGGGNTSVGIDAGISISSGTGNSFMGWGAGSQNSSGSFNSFFGSFAGRLNTFGFSNTFVGDGAGEQNTIGNENAILGTSAGRSNTRGSQNAFFGVQAGFTNQIGNNNSFFGNDAGFNNTGSDNSFFGANAGQSNTSGEFNSFFGRNSGLANTLGDRNAFFGYNSGMRNTIGNRNAYFGWMAGTNTTEGCCNSFFGNRAGEGNTNGRSNVYIGGSAGLASTESSFNTFVGDIAGRRHVSGDFNTFLGYSSGEGPNPTGTNITLLGAHANTGADNLTNATAVGANAIVSLSNSVVLGNNANVGIGTPAPGSKLTVAGLIETTAGGVKFPDGTTQTTAAGASSITDITAGGGLTGGGNTGNLTLDVGAGAGINVASDTISIADAGVTTAKLADSAVIAPKIAAGQVVKSLTVGTSTLRDDLSLAAGSGITLTPTGNTVTIAALGGSGGLPAPGSPDYIQSNPTGQQAGASFNIGGSGRVGGTLSANNIGIGTATPAHRLSIVGGPDWTTDFWSGAMDLQNAAAIGWQSNNAGQRFGIGHTNRGLLMFRTASNPGQTTTPPIYDMAIDNSGSVGIGTTFPQSKLHVNASGVAEASITSSNGRAVLSLGSRIGGLGAVRTWTLESGLFGSSQLFGIYDRNAGRARLVIDSDGYIGIGTHIPRGSHRLTVDGGIITTDLAASRVQLLTPNPSNFQVCHNNQFFLGRCASSLRYKTNLLAFSEGLNFVNQLRPISFKWKSDGTADIGFGAEDVARINPLFVTYNDKGQVEGVKYDRLSVVFVNAIKEQQAQIERQQQQIDDLKKLVCLAHPTAEVCKQ